MGGAPEAEDVTHVDPSSHRRSEGSVTDAVERDQIITLEGPVPLDDLVGKRWISRFRIVRLLGCGGMGEVWAAVSDDVPGKMLAVKVISLEHAHRREVLERFFAEAVAASALEDQNVIEIVGTGLLEDGRPVLVMEYVDGPSLQSMVEDQGPLPLDTIGQLMIQAASALRAAHARSIIHRDIKPSNMLVCHKWGRTTHLILCDFGIAKLADPQLAGNLRTRTRTFMGTPGFVAPEQAHGRTIDAKVDLYALGVVLYRVLTGRLPYQGDSELETLTLQTQGAPFPPPTALRPETPPAWDALVRDCVQLDPARRPSAVEFARRIAAGIPNGKSLLKALAPMIAVQRGRSAVFAATLSIDIPTALAQLSAQYDVPQVATRGGVRKLGLAAAAGVLAGSLATLLALRLVAPAERVSIAEHGTTASAPLAGGAASGSPDGSATSGSPDAAPREEERRVAQPPPDAGMAGMEDAVQHAAQPAGVSSPVDAPGAGRAPVAAVAPPISRTAEPGTPASVTRPSGTEAPRAVKPATGRISVSVRPFADVYIDGRLVGSTPVDAVVPAGKHTVRLVNQPRGRDETITVIVEPSKPVILEKSW
jgi:eukaryotic-like serine/threonine-protein kinase